MVKVEAMVNDDHTDVTVSMEGLAIEIANETLSAIQALMSDLKKNGKMIHLLVVKEIADDPSILLGEDYESDKAKDFERLVATTKFREGLN